MEHNRPDRSERDPNRIYSREIMTNMMAGMSNQIQINNLTAFKEFLEDSENEMRGSINAIQYIYDVNINVFRQLETGQHVQVNPSQVMNALGMGGMAEANENSPMGGFAIGPMGGGNPQVWEELLDNEALIRNQHDILAGRLPEAHNEVVLIVNEDNTISDFTLYALGLRSQEELAERFARMNQGEELERRESVSYSFEEILELEFKLVLESEYFERVGNVWVARRHDEEFMQNIIENAEVLSVVGIIRPNESAVNNSSSPGVIAYTSALTRHVIERVNNSEIVMYQRENPGVDVFTGVVDIDSPQSIRIFPASFEGKENITEAIEAYNQRMRDEGREEYVINYTDIIGLMMNSVTSIINMISYVLIAFVGISLIVSSIMIGIITYISVLERTKEIGILRSIGASKKDISRVFNAETLIIGAVAGLIGIGITLLLIIPANIIIEAATDVPNLARLPITGAIVLILISIILTVIAGLIPSKLASKKDPVIALRTE